MMKIVPSVLFLITARGGSKGVPGKNVRLLGGRPLIAWTIEAARKSKFCSRLVLSTDDPEIARVGREWGAEVPFMRPQTLAGDATPHIDVLEHAIRWLGDEEKYDRDYLLLLQPTSPFRTTQDIDDALNLAFQRNADAVVSVCEANPHPYLVKKILDDGTLADFFGVPSGYLRRQDLPKAYALNGAVFICKTDIIREKHTTLPEGTLGFVMSEENSHDIDTLWDFHVAELIANDRARSSIDNNR